MCSELSSAVSKTPSHHVWIKPLRNNLQTVLNAQKPWERDQPNSHQPTHSVTCSLIHTLNWASSCQQTGFLIVAALHRAHMQAIYIVQPRSLTQSLMFVCLSSFHLNPIKTLFQTSWIFLSCHGCRINALHQLLGKTVWLQEAFMSPNAKSQEDFWYSIYQSLFWFPFLVSSYFYIMSLIVWKESWDSSPTFLGGCPPLTITATLSHFLYTFLTTGCNYLMRVPVYPGLTPSGAFVPLYVCYDISARILTCSFVPVTVSSGLTVCLTDRPTNLPSDWLTDGHSALFFWSKQ